PGSSRAGSRAARLGPRAEPQAARLRPQTEPYAPRPRPRDHLPPYPDGATGPRSRWFTTTGRGPAMLPQPGRRHRPEARLTAAVGVLRADGPAPLGMRPC